MYIKGTRNNPANNIYPHGRAILENIFVKYAFILELKKSQSGSSDNRKAPSDKSSILNAKKRTITGIIAR